ncbi:MAG: NADH-quinone oxidoreductase subunit NuoH [Leptospiraceae bacterium]|nr:NADH-quinone oxidoreductase subunit NuoH [Leptospiraceae bacterium]MDW8305662.1 NADH-quinone oxidoreductase subunit NuoH [Leptospiraceae bacterium]
MAWYQSEIFWTVVKIALTFFVLITGAAYYTLMERKWAGYFQDRYGPNRAGWGGFFQPLADGIKFLTKMETIPRNVDTVLFLLAPAVSVVSAILLWAAIPFTPVLNLGPKAEPILGSQQFILQTLNPNAGILFVFAIGSLAVYGIMLAGWSSNNKYSLLGSVRSTAQMISYELTLGMSVIPIVLMAGHLDLYKIIEAQKETWFLFTLPGFIAFWLFVISMFAETNRLPFDLAEAESELVVGFHTEYGGFKFALFFIAEYMNMITLSFLAALLFLGGWNIPFFIPVNLHGEWWAPLVGVFFYVLKALFFVFLFVWVRWSLPRFRYDQLMHLGWRVLLPIALANIFLAGIYVYVG